MAFHLDEPRRGADIGIRVQIDNSHDETLKDGLKIARKARESKAGVMSPGEARFEKSGLKEDTREHFWLEMGHLCLAERR
jgi:hypothetical protein